MTLLVNSKPKIQDVKFNNRIKFSQEDPKLSLMIKRRGLSNFAIKNYNTVFNEIYELFKLTPSELITLAKYEEKLFKTEDGGWDIRELDDRTITKIQYDYKSFLDSKGLSDRTIKLKLDTFRAILGEYGIEKPKTIKIYIPKDRIREKDIVSWSDVERAMDICNGIRDKSIISLMATSGLRGVDVVSMSIKTIVDACSIYFGEYEEHTIENLLAKSPDDIVPCFELMPSKTKKKSQLCVTFCTPEATGYLWQYLKDRIYDDIQKGGDGTLDPNAPLFLSGKHNVNGGFLRSDAISRIFKKINDRMGEEKDINGKYGKFRKHSLRKLFSSTYRKNITKVFVNADKTSEIDILSIFTGHIPPNESNSKVYEAIPEDSHESYLRQTYFALIPYLSIKPTEVCVVNSKEAKNFDDKIKALEKESRLKDAHYQRELEEKDKEIANLKRQLVQTINKVEETSNAMEKLTINKTFNNITNAILNYYDEHYSDGEMLKLLVVHLAVEYAMDNKSEFEFSDEYLASLIKKVKIKISLSRCSIEEQVIKLGIIDTANGENLVLSQLVDELCDNIKNNNVIMDIIEDIDYDDLKNTIKLYLLNSHYDLDKIPEDKKLEIIENVLLEYV